MRSTVSHILFIVALAAVCALRPVDGSQAAQSAHRAANAGCGDYLILGVRGSGQKATDYDGWGRETATIRDGLLSKAPGYVVDQKAVDYTAAAVSVMAPTASQVALMTSRHASLRKLGFELWRQTRLGAFLRSIANGVERVNQEVQSALVACPDRSIVLVGYSQGSMAIHRALVDLAKSGDSRTLGSIAAVALLADGDHFPGSVATDLGSGSDDAQGIAYFGRSYRNDIPSIVSDRTYGYCTDNDIVCDATIVNLANFVSGKAIHTGYPEQELLDFGRIIGSRTFRPANDGGGGDGPNSGPIYPGAVAAAPDGSIYVADLYSFTVWRIAPNGKWS